MPKLFVEFPLFDVVTLYAWMRLIIDDPEQMKSQAFC